MVAVPPLERHKSPGSGGLSQRGYIEGAIFSLQESRGE